MSKTEVLQVGVYPSWDEGPLNDTFTMHRYFEAADKVAFIKTHAQGIKAIATRGDLGADRALIDALPNLELISVYGVGYDAVNMKAAGERGIRVTNTPDVLTKDVADLAVGMMLAQSRGILGAEGWVRSGSWAGKGQYGLQSRVHEKSVGILGLGRIGTEIGKRLAAFDMDISYHTRTPKSDSSNWTYISDVVKLAKRSDYLFVALSASAETRHIVNREVISALGDEGMLINISRASNIDEDALLDALETGALGSAALDVFDGEPALNPRFLKLDNVLLQPHHASGTVETRKAMGKLVYDNLVAHFNGKDLLTPVL
ncbi:MAG: 2-hydroxyacid dehydrogenase [Hyphomicrobiales bacterium]